MITVDQLKKIKEKNQDMVNFRREGGEKGKGKYRSHVLVCAGTGCTSSGSHKIADKLEQEIKAAEADMEAHACDYEKYSAAYARKEELDARLLELMERWEQLAAEAEA